MLTFRQRFRDNKFFHHLPERLNADQCKFESIFQLKLNNVINYSDRKVSVSAKTETEYSAEYSADTECSVIFKYSAETEYSVAYVYRNRDLVKQLNDSNLNV